MMQVDQRGVQIASATLYAIVVITASFRLFLRGRTRTWWWDDLFSLFSMLTMAMLVAGTHLVDSQATVTAENSGLDLTFRQQKEQLGYCLLALGYYNPIWSARLSVLFTIIRFAPQKQERRVLTCIAALFLLQWFLLLLQSLVSTRTKQWNNLDDQPNSMAIAQLITSLISDGLLIMAPVWIIRKAQLDAKLRFRLISLFSISVFSTIMGILPVVLAVYQDFFGALLAVVAQVFISSIVCNAFVILLVITVGRHGNKDELSGTALSTFIYPDSPSFVASPDSKGDGEGVRNRRPIG